MTDYVREFNRRYHQPHLLKAKLQALGYKQAAVAKYLNITPAYLYQILGGYCRMSDHIEAALASLVVAAEEANRYQEEAADAA